MSTESRALANLVEEGQQVVPSQSLTPLVPEECGIGETAFSRVEFQNAFFHRIACNQSMDDNRSGLADSVRAIGRLIFHRRVPPGIEEEDMIGGRQVEPGAPGFERDEHHGSAFPFAETANDLGPVSGGSVQSFVLQAGILKRRFTEIKQGSPLREDQGLVSLRDRLLQSIHQESELGGLRGMDLYTNRVALQGDSGILKKCFQ